MRAAEWKRLTIAEVKRTGAEWKYSKALAYVAPVDWVVHGVFGEGSGRSAGEFYVWRVQLPLMVPHNGVLKLTWSNRVGGASTTYSEDSRDLAAVISLAASEALWHSRAGSVLVEPHGGADSLKMQEARAYGFVIQGNVANASELLRRIGNYNLRYPWEMELLERTKAIASLLQSARLIPQCSS